MVQKKKRKKVEVQSKTKKKRGKKGKQEESLEGEDESNAVAEAQVDEQQPDESEAPGANYLDASFWKTEREGLDGSFDAARSLITRYGPWQLPDSVAGSKFADVAKATISKMNKTDRYSVFADSVSDSEAPGYSEVVKKPMDFGAMMKKVDRKGYGRGSNAAAALYEDFMLVFDNCRLYNPEDSEVSDEAARILALLPEAFAAACIVAAKRK